jgi:hypothetical protein
MRIDLGFCCAPDGRRRRVKEWWITGKRPDGSDFECHVVGDTSTEAKAAFTDEYPGCVMTWGMLIMEHDDPVRRLT